MVVIQTKPITLLEKKFIDGIRIEGELDQSVIWIEIVSIPENGHGKITRFGLPAEFVGKFAGALKEIDESYQKHMRKLYNPVKQKK